MSDPEDQEVSVRLVALSMRMYVVVVVFVEIRASCCQALLGSSSRSALTCRGCSKRGIRRKEGKERE